MKEYDYSQVGGYFVTICTYDKKCVLGNIVEGRMVLSNIGKIVSEFWPEISRHFGVELDEFVVMPNHVHGVIMIGCGNGEVPPQPQGGETPPLRKPTLGQIV